jgi:hypothetical protein
MSDPSSKNRLAIVHLRAIADVNGYNRIAEFLGVQPFPAGFAPSVENTQNSGLDCAALNVSCEWIASQSACKREVRGAALLFFQKTRAAYRELRTIAFPHEVNGRSVFDLGFNESCPKDPIVIGS